MSRWRLVSLVGLLLGVAIAVYIILSSPITPQPELVQVARVIDGDSIELAGGQQVRYIGIDAPELFDNKKQISCGGEAAYQANKSLVEGKSVRLVRDVSDRDKYGRLLRYVYLDDILVNEYLLMSGLAYAWAYPPDVKLVAKFKGIYESARNGKKGLWGELCQAQD